MSAEEEVPAEEVEEEEVEEEEISMSVADALKEVLKTALIHDGLKKGLHECAREIDRQSAKLCCLAKNCDNAEYTKLIKALCAESQVPIISVDDGKDLGAMCGLAKLDDEGEVKKAVRTTCAVVTDFGEETRALAILKDYLENQEE
mmetsp:Transcript_4755/g.2899  ORF Transcript_4755/g.2899 Transcript_4755/m.2899 type:complete len:146 (-) Transcript_4755:69-506(-)